VETAELSPYCRIVECFHGPLVDLYTPLASERTKCRVSHQMTNTHKPSLTDESTKVNVHRAHEEVVKNSSRRFNNK
jgi:hypothetical protein